MVGCVYVYKYGAKWFEWARLDWSMALEIDTRAACDEAGWHDRITRYTTTMASPSRAAHYTRTLTLS